MADNSVRNKLEIKLYCEKHPSNELNFCTESKIGASSAYEINAKILIVPCSRCRQEIERIENAAKVLMGLANKPSEQ